MIPNQISAVQVFEDRTSGQSFATVLEQMFGYMVRGVPANAPLLAKTIAEKKTDIILYMGSAAGLATVSAAQRVANECGLPVIVVMPTESMSRYGDRENLYCLTYLKTKPVEDVAREINTKIHVAIASFRSRAVQAKIIADRQGAGSGAVSGTGTVSVHSQEQRTETEKNSVEPRIGRPAFDSQKLIAIGASAGGTEAIYNVMVKLSDDLPGIVIVQHMPEGFTNMYAKRLDMNCAMKVVQASNAQKVERGWAYVAPGGKQLQVKRNSDGYYIYLYDGERVSGHMPSVDVMFDSVAKCAGKNALGIILTGMGSDGAKGLLALRQTGAHTVGQNQETCLVYGMPRVAFEIGGVAEQLALNDIPSRITRYVDGK